MLALITCLPMAFGQMEPARKQSCHHNQYSRAEYLEQFQHDSTFSGANLTKTEPTHLTDASRWMFNDATPALNNENPP